MIKSRRSVLIVVSIILLLCLFLIFHSSHQIYSVQDVTHDDARKSIIDKEENNNNFGKKHQAEISEGTTKTHDAEASIISRGEHSDNDESERLHIAMISHGWNLPAAKAYHNPNTIKGPDLSLKMTVAGILRYTTSPVTLYFVVGEDDKPRIRALMAPIRYWRRSLEWAFVPLDEAKLDEWMSFIGHRPSHRTGMAGNIKFFYPLVFPARITRLLMLDTDILVQHDMRDLWRHFERFEQGQLYAMAPQWQGSVHPTRDNQFNAGVMLLRLDRMREAQWLQLARDSIDNWHAKGFTPRCCSHGDQTVFHMIRVFRKGALGLAPPAFIPRHWNVNKCHGYQGLKSSGDQLPKHMPYVGLVHLGCCKLCTKDKIGPRWARVVDVLNGTNFEEYFGSAENGRKKMPELLLHGNEKHEVHHYHDEKNDEKKMMKKEGVVRVKFVEFR